MAYTPPTIDDQGGITPFLAATKNKHKGYDASDIHKNWNWGTGKHMNIANLAIMFDVSWQTMSGWLQRLHKEAGKPWPPAKGV